MLKAGAEVWVHCSDTGWVPVLRYHLHLFRAGAEVWVHCLGTG